MTTPLHMFTTMFYLKMSSFLHQRPFKGSSARKRNQFWIGHFQPHQIEIYSEQIECWKLMFTKKMFTFLKDLRSACFSQVSITHRPEVQTTDRDMTVHCKYPTQHSTLDTEHSRLSVELFRAVTYFYSLLLVYHHRFKKYLFYLRM